MKRYLVVILLASLCQFNSFSQEKINNYKYIIIPMKYEFQKSDDQYQINSLTKFLFNKYGYTALLENEDFPKDLATNRCLGLEAMVKKVKGGFLQTKIQIDLIDCKNQVVASSIIGKTKEKAYEKAYNFAIRDAFKTYQNFNYEYAPNPVTTTVTIAEPTSQEKEIERLKKEVENLKEKTITTPISPTTDTQKVIENTSTSETKVISPKAVKDHTNQKDVLYAQPIDGGFQVVDTEPKAVMILLHSGIEGHFIVKGKDAVVYKKGSTWYFAENDGTTLKTKELHLKF